MLLSDVCGLLKCEMYGGEQEVDVKIEYGCASDLMSDVLAFSQSGSLLLTGLATPQTIQTAFVADIRAVVFVRGKRPGSDVIALAHEKRIPLLGTQYSMFEASGILYRAGLPSTMVTKSSLEAWLGGKGPHG
jgi:predicted transcriptional regulator